jgi:hypothetical protein
MKQSLLSKFNDLQEQRIQCRRLGLLLSLSKAQLMIRILNILEVRYKVNPLHTLDCFINYTFYEANH